MSAFPNLYTHRKVAGTAAKACEICYKTSTSVLVTPDKKDFFYVCPAHLKQPGFCKPVVDQAAIDAKRKQELDEEVERVKKEYEERQRKKKDKEEADKTKDKDQKAEAAQQDKEGEENKAEPAKTDVEKVLDETAEPPKEEDEPRVFELYRTFYQNRLAQKRQSEMAKRNRERLESPNFFPSVPKGLP